MKRVKIAVDWIEDSEPANEGLYFVAVRYPTGFGSYDFVEWDGERWVLDASAKVVGWVATSDFLKNMDAGWPAGDKKADEEFEAYHEKNKDSFNDKGFVELD